MDFAHTSHDRILIKASKKDTLPSRANSGIQRISIACALGQVRASKGIAVRQMGRTFLDIGRGVVCENSTSEIC